MLPHISPTLLLYIVLGVILVGGLAPFVYKLFVLYIKLPFNNWGKPMKAEPNFVDVSLEDVPKETLTKVAQIAQMFAAFGFKAASHARADNNLANTESYQSIWLSPESGTTATLFVIRIRIRDQIRDNISCGFVTEFDDGTSLVISNSKYGTIFVRDPLCDSLHWPRFQKLDVMFELHR
ncbi:MAG TPA: hypothetical protein VL282_11125, partial [Tepidisphaeraceae bacterium]|nr:hypothetical protein [Tepidisphaeraceae bacterium]